MSGNEKIMWWTIAGIVLFWIIAIPAMALSKPFGAGPQPTSGGGGTGA